jgi:transcriptional regulator with XRE-family HTH domain
MVSRSARTPPLRVVREARGLGLREVARRAQIDPSQLSKVERGEGQLSLSALARLARVLGLAELERLLRPYVVEGGEAEREPAPPG